jgi:Acyl-CoA dehydrogenase, C-terminal domain
VDRPNGAFVTAAKIRERFIKIGLRVIEHIAHTRPRSAT